MKIATQFLPTKSENIKALQDRLNKLICAKAQHKFYQGLDMTTAEAQLVINALAKAVNARKPQPVMVKAHGSFKMRHRKTGKTAAKKAAGKWESPAARKARKSAESRQQRLEMMGSKHRK